MDMKINKGIPLATLLLLLLVSIISSSHSLSSLDANSTELSFPNLISSTVFPLKKHAETPSGFAAGYTVSLKIGNSVQPFNLFIDTGSDLAWVQCDYKDRQGLTMPVDKLYKPHKNFVQCGTPLCVAVQKKENLPCANPEKLPCMYKIGYLDGLETKGFLVSDGIPIENVVGHCLSGKKGGGGYLFFGDNFIPKPPSHIISWTSMQSPPKNKKIAVEGRYFSGLANLFYDEKPTSIRGLQFMFDSGTSYSYFNSKDYNALVELINIELNFKGRKFTQRKLKRLTCWNGDKKFNSIEEVKEYLKPIILSFPVNLQFQLLVEDYIRISDFGNICMAIHDSDVAGFNNINVIGGFSRKILP